MPVGSFFVLTGFMLSTQALRLIAPAGKRIPLGQLASGDTAHVARVWRNAKAIQLEDGGDLEVLAAAVLLHDCVVVPKNSPPRSQASRPAAAEATAHLMALGWSAVRGPNG